jgi:hypothetical protein
VRATCHLPLPVRPACPRLLASQKAYNAAKAVDDLEEALRIRKELLAPLKTALASQEQQDAWRAPPLVPPAAELGAAAEEALADADRAALFRKTFCQPLEQATATATASLAQGKPLSHGELAATGALHLEAHAACRLLSALPLRALHRFVRQWVLLLRACDSQLEAVRAPLQAFLKMAPAQQAALAAADAPGSEFLRAAAALCTAGRLLRAAIEHHSTYWPEQVFAQGQRTGPAHVRATVRRSATGCARRSPDPTALAPCPSTLCRMCALQTRAPSQRGARVLLRSRSPSW